MATRSQGLYKGELRATEKHLAKGALMYFVRLQMAHLTEGMKVLQQLETVPSFKRVFSSCRSSAQEAYKRLIPFTQPGPEKTWFDNNVATTRSNLTFHYHESGKWINWALADRASRAVAERSSITYGDHGHLWRFHIADNILDSIMCRKIWKIPKSSDVQKEADIVISKIYNIYRNFINFALVFMLEYLKQTIVALK